LENKTGNVVRIIRNYKKKEIREEIEYLILADVNTIIKGKKPNLDESRILFEEILCGPIKIGPFTKVTRIP
jgi:hypothetical protein